MKATIEELGAVVDAARIGRELAVMVDRKPKREFAWLAKAGDLQRFVCLQAAYQTVRTMSGLNTLVRLQFEWLATEVYDTELGHQRRTAWKRIASADSQCK
jgi:hypothetical protein